MKIRLPEFPSVEDIEEFPIDFDIVPSNWENCDLYCKITLDSCTSEMYGYISPNCWYDSAFATSDDFTIKFREKDDYPNQAQCRAAYKKIVKQLRERYEQWVIENIMEE